MTLQQLDTSSACARIPIPHVRADVAFAHKGAKAAVFKPRFGQAHQQYLCAV